MPVPITRPLIDEEDCALVLEALRSGWVVQGPRVAEFEQAFATYVGATHAVATTSCTTALHLALLGLGIGPGDEVVVPSFTWIASANAVEYCGARPIFCDIDLATYNVGVAQIEPALSAATKAVMPVHLFGLCAEMVGIGQLATKQGFFVVEDAACALGGLIGGRHAGCWGDVGCFSFHPRKAITTGEGGMLISDDAELAMSVRSLRDHGASVSDRDRHTSPRPFDLPEFRHVGFNYRMTDLQAALGCGQMRKVNHIIARRRELAARYDDELRGLSWLRTPCVPEDFEHGYQAYVCLVTAEAPEWLNLETNGAFRDRVMVELADRGISTRPGTHAVHLQRYYADHYGLRPEQFPFSAMAQRQTMALPLYPQMTYSEQDEVIIALREI